MSNYMPGKVWARDKQVKVPSLYPLGTWRAEDADVRYRYGWLYVFIW